MTVDEYESSGQGDSPNSYHIRAEGKLCLEGPDILHFRSWQEASTTDLRLPIPPTLRFALHHSSEAYILIGIQHASQAFADRF